ncbi:hypothetical protein CERSUDRAFT_44780, partial [Gelatoporia subvermispora B]
KEISFDPRSLLGSYVPPLLISRPILSQSTDFEDVVVPYCGCHSVAHVLVASGMFPTAPVVPRIAISIDLLEFYSALFERSGDAVTALARALRNLYSKRGWRALDQSGWPVLDPFRKPIGHAVQWYDALRTAVERHVEDTIDNARKIIANHLDRSQGTSVLPISAQPSSTPPLSAQPSSTPPRSAQPSSTPPLSAQPHSTPPLSPPTPLLLECASILQRRCPACFGGGTFGRRFPEGGDIVVALDGNFSHRHLRSSGDSPHFYEPEFFIPKATVDAVGSWLDGQRKKPSNKSYKPKVPDEAIDTCESGHEAANEQKAKTNGDRFDDTGIMALVCGHDIPIFLANIDSPGEQQKYAFSLIFTLFAYLPQAATVTALYDIACKSDRSNGRHDLLPLWISERLQWAVSVMHAYRHEWACQLVYNPRLREGLGLRDGEGVERLWSRLRVFIPITRTSGRSRRIWILDRQVRALAYEMRDHLGAYIVRRLKTGVKRQSAAAKAILQGTSQSIGTLRQEWEAQRITQLSVRAHAPARLRREVDAVIALQADIERVEYAIEGIRTQFRENRSSSESSGILARLFRTSADLSDKVDSLYTSLNVANTFPELKGLHINFVRMLLLTRDIKINIRKRVTAQLLEFDRLDRAAGGRSNPLGTKMHQITRKAISKRQPGILNSIRKFNKYCVALKDAVKTYHVPQTFPVPHQLSTNLGELRDDPNLYEDVWISSPPIQTTPKWLEDASVRCGIRAMLKLDRCDEEEQRLKFECENLQRWFGRELAATKLALRLSNSE